MSRGRLQLSMYIVTLVFALYPIICKARLKGYHCKPFSCGSLQNIRSPFRLKGGDKLCGNPELELICENNRTVLHLFSGKYYVLEIIYEDRGPVIRIVDVGVEKNNCSSLPLYSLSVANFTSASLPFHTYFSYRSLTFHPYGSSSSIQFDRFFDSDSREDSSSSGPFYLYDSKGYLTLIKCERAVNDRRYVETAACTKGVSTISSLKPRSYVLLGRPMVSEIPDTCSIDLMVPSIHINTTLQNMSFLEIHRNLAYGFKIRFVSYSLHRVTHLKARIIGTCFILRMIYGVPFAAALLYCKQRRSRLSMSDNIEDFLQNHNNLVPTRYSYAEIKKITKGFREKLGEGGYGSVFKGKHRNGYLVAIKILDKTKTSGQDFINEVSTIGVIHHFNVVRLIGFCAEGSRRALVYDYMPNGSLDKYIFRHGGKSISLSCEKLYEISLGVARGIEYLHRGCDMQILHFDIKPHNILLDENFNPKVSDFGLAKRYSTDNNIVSLTTARGTIGYIAPEFLYKYIGGISFKADVYSFGMLLMEMAGRRKNLDPSTNQIQNHPSQIYFPSWVYEQFSTGKEMEIVIETDEERETIKKMMIVALWCIQMNPNDRPSMKKVLNMLEGKLELLQLPPDPFDLPQEIPSEGHGSSLNPTEI